MMTATVPCKIAVVGDPESGKTSVLKRFVSNVFSSAYKPTLEASVAVVVRKVNVPDDLIVSLSFLDTPGRDNMDLRKTYFENLDAAIVVADATSDSALALAGVWRQLVINAASNSPAPGLNDPTVSVVRDIPMILLANKYDQVQDTSRPLKTVTSSKREGSASEEPSAAPSAKEQNAAEAADLGDLDSGTFSPSAHSSMQPDHLEAELRDAVNKNGFMEGFFVSAKDPDGGIHQAINFLLHRLAELRLPLLRQSAGATLSRRISNGPPTTADEEHIPTGAVATSFSKQGPQEEKQQRQTPDDPEAVAAR